MNISSWQSSSILSETFWQDFDPDDFNDVNFDEEFFEEIVGSHSLEEFPVTKSILTEEYHKADRKGNLQISDNNIDKV